MSTLTKTMHHMAEVLSQEVKCRRGKHKPIEFLPDRCEYCFSPTDHKHDKKKH